MSAQQNTENPDQLGRIIDILYTYDKSKDNSQAKSKDESETSTTMLPPLRLRSDIYISKPEIQANLDFERYRTGDYKIDDIIYHLEYKSRKYDQDQALYIYTFNYRSLVPRSQQKSFEVWVTSGFGVKLQKTKSSTTRIEIYIEPITKKKEDTQQTPNNNNNNFSYINEPAQVSLGMVIGNFKERYSNTVIIDLLVKYV